MMEDVSQCIQDHAELDTLNLDVTAMMAYVSNMTNGHCNFVFKQEVLTQQSAWEAERPVKPILERLFEGDVSFIRLLKHLHELEVISYCFCFTRIQG